MSSQLPCPKLQCFRVDTEKCTFGTVTAKGEYKERANFSIELETYVDCCNAGYFAWITRKSDKQRRYVTGVKVSYE